jgi:ABC-2 type transport system permease protein
VPGSTLLSVLQIPLDKLALSLVYFVVGYLLFASLIAGSGMLGRTAQEGAQLSALWTFTAASPWFFIANLAVSPNGWLARALSFFPLTSPITMMLRIGSGDVPPIDIVLSLAIDAAAIYVALRGASRIFRAATLMHGKRATLPEFLRWMRATKSSS